MFARLFGKKKPAVLDPEAAAAARHNIDREAMYCPDCGDEYRAGIVQCANCRVALISGKEKLAAVLAKSSPLSSRTTSIAPTDRLATIRTGKLADLKMVQRLLAGAEIPAMIVAEAANCGKGWGGPDLRLEVRTDDVDQALAIIADDYRRSTALDSHDLTTAGAIFDEAASRTVCPACGCIFAPTVALCPDCGLSFGG